MPTRTASQTTPGARAPAYNRHNDATLARLAEPAEFMDVLRRFRQFEVEDPDEVAQLVAAMQAVNEAAKGRAAKRRTVCRWLNKPENRQVLQALRELVAAGKSVR